MDITLEDLGEIAAVDIPTTPALAPTSVSNPVSNHYSPGATSSLEDKAMSLLGSGVAAESVASALGVTAGRIAQLLSDETFSAEVSKLRYKSLQEHNVRDGKYDSLEDKLIEKLRNSLPLMVKPADILNAVRVVNSAKRRGQSAPQQVTNQQNIINLTLPTIIANKFSVDMNNQVVRAGEQELLTLPSGALLKQIEDKTALQTAAAQIEQIGGLDNVPEKKSQPRA